MLLLHSYYVKTECEQKLFQKVSRGFTKPYILLALNMTLLLGLMCYVIIINLNSPDCTHLQCAISLHVTTQHVKYAGTFYFLLVWAHIVGSVQFYLFCTYFILSSSVHILLT